jgi:hypothetical protein
MRKRILVGGEAARRTCCPPAAPQLMWGQPPRLSSERSEHHG